MGTLVIRKNKKSHDIITTDYIAKFNNKSFSFSEHRYGKYAKLLAEYTIKHEDEILKNNKRPQVYIEEKINYSIMKIYSKTYGYIDVLIDNDDVEKVRYLSWMVSKRITGDGFYIRNNKVGRLHRYILNLSETNNALVDHKNRNTLDNRKYNLRIVNQSINMKNIKIQSNNKSGMTGVRCDGKKWWAQISINGKQTIKSFSISKYGNDIAKQKAIEWRIEKEKENDYLGEKK